MDETAASDGSEGPRDRRQILLYGASGYTGRLIAAELSRRGADVILAGRDRAKLERIAAELEPMGGSREVAAVPLDDRASLRRLVARSAVVIGCAGPFTLHGEPLIAAAAESGTHYLDTTGEQPFIRAAFERWGEAAARSGGGLISGFGFDYAPGDMLAALTAADLERIDEITIAYSVRGFRPTRGTTLSALEMVRGGDVEWRGGALEPAPRDVGAGRFTFPSPIGSRRVGRYPAGEVITVPRHVEVATMRLLIDLRSLVGAPLGPLAAPALTGAGMAMTTPLRKTVAKLIDRLPEGPDETERQAARFTIACSVQHAGGRRRGIVRGHDVYGTTAVTIAEGATRMAAPGYRRTGALAPAQAFDPGGFLACLEPFGVTTEIEPLDA